VASRLSVTIRPILWTALTIGSAGAEVNAQEAATLPKVQVSADEDAADGYRIEEIRSATRTATPLRNVPQSITVITRDLIQDQSMQSLADVAIR